MTTSVGALIRAQSGAKSSACCIRTRAAITGGIIGADSTRAVCRTEKSRRDRQSGSAAQISGHKRRGDVRTNAGVESHGRAT